MEDAGTKPGHSATIALLEFPPMPDRPADQPHRACPYCEQPLTERFVSRSVNQADKSVRLLACSNGHEFAWRDGLTDLLPRRA